MIISFCFLLTVSFPMEEVWERFFEDQRDYIIVIHGKPSLELKTEFFKHKANILKPIDTKWGNISLVYAQNLMLEYSVNVKMADFCCILSGNCIPVKNYKYIYNNLEATPISRFYLSESYLPIFKKKQSQWCVLSLEHIQIILKYADIYSEIFKTFNLCDITPFGAPDEYFYVNLLLWKNINNFLSEGSTYCKWYNINLVHPKEYKEISKERLLKVEKSHYFFMRKILKECKIKDEDIRLTEYYEPGILKKRIVLIELKEFKYLH